VSNYESIDYFTDESILDDPYPYYEHLRSQCPVQPTGYHGVVAVTGYDEAAQVYRDNDSYSACNVVGGPFMRLPVPLEGSDVPGIIERYRDHIPQNDHIVTMDPPMHTRERALLMRLLTPKRLKENESIIGRLTDRQLDEFLPRGRCEFISAFAQPLSMLVIADLLGVPEAHYQLFREGFGLASNNNFSMSGAAESDTGTGPDYGELNSLSWLYDWFAGYIEERRREPRNDVLTDLALAKYPDGSTPEVMAVAHQAAVLFASGQETTARLLGAALVYLAEDPELQAELRARPDRVPDFIEECLRMESPIKADFRLAKQATRLAGVDIAPGTPVVIFIGAANRDRRRFDCPSEFRMDRSNSKEHISFGRGIHSCPGGPLARAEGRISIERILARTRDIRLSEQHHGPPSDRHFEYEPSWLLRALHELHLEFTPLA
jgi:cytochrome P450